MNNIDKKIVILLEKSIVTQELKDYFYEILDRLSEKQKIDLLNILEDEQKLIQIEIEREKSTIYKELLLEMKTFAKDFKRKYVGELEIVEKQKEEAMLESLEDQLNNE